MPTLASPSYNALFGGYRMGIFNRKLLEVIINNLPGECNADSGHVASVVARSNPGTQTIDKKGKDKKGRTSNEVSNEKNYILQLPKNCNKTAPGHIKQFLGAHPIAALHPGRISSVEGGGRLMGRSRAALGPGRL
ncbi:hypothetical protein ACJJTC_017256 [Scirpophaga incertulas]